MQFIPRVRTPEIFKFIKPHLQFSEDWTAERIIDEFTALMINYPDNVLISAVVDGEEVVGFVMSFAPVGPSNTVLAQAWVKPGVDEVYAKMGFAALVRWTQSLGRKSIKCETTRDEAICRKWGFEHFSEVLNFNVTNITTDLIMKGSVDGTIKPPVMDHSSPESAEATLGEFKSPPVHRGSNGDDKHVEPDAAAGEPAGVPADATGTGNGGDSVHRAVDSSVDISVQ